MVASHATARRHWRPATWRGGAPRAWDRHRLGRSWTPPSPCGCPSSRFFEGWDLGCGWTADLDGRRLRLDACLLLDGGHGVACVWTAAAGRIVLAQSGPPAVRPARIAMTGKFLVPRACRQRPTRKRRRRPAQNEMCS